MTPADLARLGLVVAEHLDRTGAPAGAGIVRRLAALVVEQHEQLQPVTGPHEPPGGPRCPVCASPVQQPSTGRRRVYCTTECRREAQARRRAA